MNILFFRYWFAFVIATSFTKATTFADDSVTTSTSFYTTKTATTTYGTLAPTTETIPVEDSEGWYIVDEVVYPTNMEGTSTSTVSYGSYSPYTVTEYVPNASGGYSELIYVFVSTTPGMPGGGYSTVGTVSACMGTPDSGNYGFKVKYYNYPWDDKTDYSSVAFMASGYLTESYYGSADNVLTPSLTFWGTSLGITNTIYGLAVHTDNFIFEYTGFFKAPTSGLYGFLLTEVDDAAMIWLGDGAFNCCDPDVSVSNIPSDADSTYLLYASKSWNGANAEFGVYIYFDAAYYIPLRLVYVNIVNFASFDFVIYDPDGLLVTDYAGIIYQPNVINGCSATSIELPSLTTTFTSGSLSATTFFSTFMNSSGSTSTEVVVVAPTTPFETVTISSGTSDVDITLTSTLTNSSGVPVGARGSYSRCEG